jgi:hypothetical protein
MPPFLRGVEVREPPGERPLGVKREQHINRGIHAREEPGVIGIAVRRGERVDHIGTVRGETQVTHPSTDDQDILATLGVHGDPGVADQVAGLGAAAIAEEAQRVVRDRRPAIVTNYSVRSAPSLEMTPDRSRDI